MKRRHLRLDRLFIVIFVFMLSITSVVAGIVTIIDSFKEEEKVEVTEIVIHEEPVYEEVVEEVKEPEYIGNFRLTGYCACKKCCGEWADGYTATMTRATAGRTVAVDPDIIPLGSHILINGVEYIAEDTGSAINEYRIDIYCDTHAQCFGEHCNGYADVYLIVD